VAASPLALARKLRRLSMNVPPNSREASCYDSSR